MFLNLQIEREKERKEEEERNEGREKNEEGKEQKRKKGGGGKVTSGHGIQTSMWTPHLCDISYKATQK